VRYGSFASRQARPHIHLLQKCVLGGAAVWPLAARHRLPAIYPYRFFAASGGLCSYGVDVAEVFRRAASYVDPILRGTRAGELPVQAPDKYEVVINLKSAKALGLDIPATVLALADEVIE